MASIDTLSHTGREKENQVVSKTEVVEPMKENSLNLAEAKPLEVRGDFSRVATFELGSNVNDEGAAVETIDPTNPYAVVLDIWTAGDKVFVLPRSIKVDDPNEIAQKAWDLADWPTGLPIGRKRNNIWQEKTGENLPGEVSGKHFGVGVKDGVLQFADVGSKNGTRMETAITEESDTDQTASRERVFAKVTGNLVMGPDVNKSIYTPPEVETSGPEAPSDNARESAANEQKPEYLEAIDKQLQVMQNTAVNWEVTLSSQPTFTYSDQLYGVSASFVTDQTTLRDMRETIKPEAGSPTDRVLAEIESTALQVQVSASGVANNIESRAYFSGAEAHAARRQVEGLLRHYESSLNELRRLINQ